MDILDLERTVKPEWWLKQIADCDWAAGPYLYTLLKENRFHALCGETARVLLLVDGTKLASFCTYAEQDDIPDTDLTPRMGFVCWRMVIVHCSPCWFMSAHRNALTSDIRKPQ